MKKFLLLFLFLASFLLAAVNINTASKDELTSIKGIGNTKAEAIIKYRETNGKFKSVDELANVKGIGKKTVEKIKNDITVD